MTAIKKTLADAMQLLKVVETELEDDASIGLTADILRALVSLDMRYQELCLDLDAHSNDDPGTTYNSDFGVSVEFYIEADDWHGVSLALRQWKNDHPNWEDELNISLPDGYV